VSDGSLRSAERTTLETANAGLPIEAATIPPIDLNRQNDAGSGCHQQPGGGRKPLEKKDPT